MYESKNQLNLHYELPGGMCANTASVLRTSAAGIRLLERVEKC